MFYVSLGRSSPLKTREVSLFLVNWCRDLIERLLSSPFAVAIVKATDIDRRARELYDYFRSQAEDHIKNTFGNQTIVAIFVHPLSVKTCHIGVTKYSFDNALANIKCDGVCPQVATRLMDNVYEVLRFVTTATKDYWDLYNRLDELIRRRSELISEGRIEDAKDIDDLIIKLRSKLPLIFFVFYGFSRSRNYLEELCNRIFTIVTFLEVTLLRYGCYLIYLTDVDLPRAEVYNFVLFYDLKTRREEVEALVERFALRFKTRYKQEITEDVKLFLVENLRELPLKFIENTLSSLLKQGKIDFDSIAKAKAEAFAHYCPFLQPVFPKHGFEAVGGYRAIKAILEEKILLPYRKGTLAKKLGLNLPRGVLFFGPQGTGKSWLSMALAKELGFPVYKLTFRFMSGLYGETEARLQEALKLLEQSAPCVLMIEEADSIFSKRGTMQEHEVTRRIKDMFLDWMTSTEAPILVIATTNRVEDLDPAFVERRGRFTLVLPILFPDEESRKDILRVQLTVVRKVPVKDPIDKIIDFIAKETRLFTADELRQLVDNAIYRALKEDRDYVTIRDFEDALNDMPLDSQILAARRELAEKYVELAQRYTSERSVIDQLRKELEEILIA